MIEHVRPSVDGGQFPAKRVVGELVRVTADIFTDGHDRIRAVVHYRGPDSGKAAAAGGAGKAGGPGGSGGGRGGGVAELTAGVNDEWEGSFRVTEMGLWTFWLEAWIDRFASWRAGLMKKEEAGVHVSSELLEGSMLVERAASAAGERGDQSAARRLEECAARLKPGTLPHEEAIALAAGDELRVLMNEFLPRDHTVTAGGEGGGPLGIWVDREKALYSTWYEMFPRSASPEPGRHGTFRDVEGRLGYIRGMGFDVLYLPPIHPIGRTKRKGPNNALEAGPGDVGSPWAIGDESGGHKSIHPALGTDEEFRRLVRTANEAGVEIAMDVAFQCSPDHPYVREHPEWFRHRPDGSIQYAENPPKKYEDIYPFDFECEGWADLWAELKSVFDHWIERGVKIFRVDNPHTKSFAFWEWCIAAVRREHPEVLFLAEAFTRPKVMARLAKIGFSQSYTYFSWRNEPSGLVEYLTELTKGPAADFFRPNFWPNTPDILTEYLQHGGRPASVIRLILASMLSSNYGIYGPPFELVETAPRDPGKEEYLDSEKYEVRTWDLEQPHSLRELIGHVNRMRRENAALRQTREIRFHGCDNPNVIVFSKRTENAENVVLCCVTTDPHNTQWANIDLWMPELGMDWHDRYQVHDMLTDARYTWQGQHQTIGLNPHASPAHVFRVLKQRRTEADFEYYV